MKLRLPSLSLLFLLCSHVVLHRQLELLSHTQSVTTQLLKTRFPEESPPTSPVSSGSRVPESGSHLELESPWTSFRAMTGDAQYSAPSAELVTKHGGPCVMLHGHVGYGLARLFPEVSYRAGAIPFSHAFPSLLPFAAGISAAHGSECRYATHQARDNASNLCTRDRPCPAIQAQIWPDGLALLQASYDRTGERGFTLEGARFSVLCFVTAHEESTFARCSQLTSHADRAVL